MWESVIVPVLGSAFSLWVLAFVGMLMLNQDFTWQNFLLWMGGMVGFVFVAGLVMAFPAILIVLLVAMGYGVGKNGRRRRR